MSRSRLILLIVATVVALCAPPAGADVRLPQLFRDGLVLQRGQPIRLWGTAAGGESVAVELAGTRAETVADADGSWRVALPALPAGGPHELVVTGRNRIVCADVLIGELWIASGQSNMEWLLEKTDGAAEEIALPANPRLRVFKVKRAQAGKPQTEVEGQWRAAAPPTRAGFTAVGYHFAKHLSAALDVPVGIIDSTWGGTSAAAWIPLPDLQRDALLAGYLTRYVQAATDFPRLQPVYEKKLAEWEAAAGPAPTREQWRSRPPQPLGPGHPSTPGALFHAMVAPLTPLQVRGIIWYQGETDATRAATYRTLFPALINAWRREWTEPALPFLFVQLAGYDSQRDTAQGSPWAELREAQTETLRLPHTGMAVALDLGERDDIHPRNKSEVGRRLALQALAKVYGQPVAAGGPVCSGHEISGSTVRVKFDPTTGNLVVRGGGELQGFTLAGEDRVFHAAQARIEGAAVILIAPAVTRPVAARYGWADYTAANLANAAGLPAGPFRTDTWPGITEDTP